MDQITQTFDTWPADVAARAKELRGLLRDTHAGIGLPPLDETLKWGQPAWRPRRGGTTLRMGWSDATPDRLSVFVDCKTDLCARMMQDFPDAFTYTPPRVMTLHVAEPLPTQALTHLAHIAFRYKRVLPAA